MNDTIAREKNAQSQRHLALLVAARAYVKRLRRAHAQYEEDVDEWYRSGPGRPRKMHVFIEGDDVYETNVGGEGLRFPECIHGRSLWVDHDIPCGTCEADSGYTIYELALQYAWQDVHEYDRRIKVLGAAMRASAPSAATEPLSTWALDALPAEFRDYRPTVRNLP